MAGAYRMALARAQLVITPPDGEPLPPDKGLTVSVRDGQAVAKRGRLEVAAMPAAELVQHSSRSFTITGPDGTTWSVTKPCNCGGR